MNEYWELVLGVGERINVDKEYMSIRAVNFDYPSAEMRRMDYFSHIWTNVSGQQKEEQSF